MLNNFGNNLRENVLKFQLDNEVVQNIIITIDEADIAHWEALSGKGVALAKGDIDLGGNRGQLKTVTLEKLNNIPVLDFTFANEHVYCNLKSLYDLIATKQNNLTAGKNINITKDVISCTLSKVSELENDVGYYSEIKWTDILERPEINPTLNGQEAKESLKGIKLDNVYYFVDLSEVVPYKGATTDIDLNNKSITNIKNLEINGTISSTVPEAPINHIVTTNSEQDINAKKVFNVAPVSNYELNFENELTPKSYVDANDNLRLTKVNFMEVLNNNIYSEAKTYKINDVVCYDGYLYRCILDINTPENFNQTKWLKITLQDLLDKKQDLLVDGVNIKTIAGESILGPGNLVLTKETVGLGNVDNTSDIDKPVSTAQAAAINSVQEELNTHIIDDNNPHKVTKAQVGLSEVANTKDTDVPTEDSTDKFTSGGAYTLKTGLESSLSVAVKELNTSIDELESTLTGADTSLNESLTAHKSDTNNPHKVTKSQVGLGNVDNTSDLNKPVSTATQEALDTLEQDLTNTISTNVDTINVTISGIQSTISNLQTKDTELESGISTLSQSISTVSSTLSSHIANKSNPHEVTKDQIGLANVTNDAQVKRSEMGVASGVATLDESGKVLLDQIPTILLGQLIDGGTFNATNATATLTSNAKTKLDTSSNTIVLVNSTDGEGGWTKHQGLYYLVSTAGSFAGLELNNSDILIATASSWIKIDNTDSVTSVAGRKGAVVLTKADVGLNNVDNTSDLNKPISTATQAALDTINNELGTKVTQSAITNAINALDVSAVSVSANSTLKSIAETDGKISVSTQPISISVDQITNISTTYLGINSPASSVKQALTINGQTYNGSAAVSINVPVDTLSTGTTNGTVKFNGTDVAVKGLGSAAYTASTAYDAAGTAQNLINSLDVSTISSTASQTITGLTQTDGKVSATFGSISISQNQVSGLSTAITGINASISSLSSTLGTLSSTVNALSATISGMGVILTLTTASSGTESDPTYRNSLVISATISK